MPKNSEHAQEGEEISFKRQSIEDILTEEGSKVYTKTGSDAVKSYEPALYEIVKDPIAANKEREGLSSMQEGFINRTERLLQIFH